jgi:hypothetical protein
LVWHIHCVRPFVSFFRQEIGYANRYDADNVFLPTYLSSRGAAFGTPSPYITWRNYTLVNFSGIWGPVLAGYMCGTRLGRKYTMVIGALVTMAFFFAYTQVRTAAQNVSQRNQFSRSATQEPCKSGEKRIELNGCVVLTTISRSRSAA